MIKNKLNLLERKIKANSTRNPKIYVLHKTTEGLWEYDLNGEKKHYSDLEQFKKDYSVRESDKILKIIFTPNVRNNI